MTGIFDIFKTTPTDQQTPQNTEQNSQQQQEAPGVGNPGNIPDPGTTSTVPEGEQKPQETKSNEPESPLDPFKDLWNTDTSTNDNNKQQEQKYELKAEDLNKIVEQVDFSSALNQDNLSAISQGGEEAIKAFSDSLNAVARQTMVQAIMVGNKLTEKAVAEAIETERATLPEKIKSHSFGDFAKTKNPIFNDPAVQPVAEAASNQLRTKFPNATNEEIVQMTEDYILAMGAAFAPPKKEESGPKEQDWSIFLDPQ